MGKEFKLATMAIIMGTICSAVFAEDLSRSQWISKIGDAASDASVLAATVAQVPVADRVEFAQKVYQAIANMPVKPEEKAANFVKAAINMINAKPTDQKKEVIAETFADIPLEYLPSVTEELAKRFNQELNNLSDDQYEKIASDTMAVASKRNEKTDEPSVRDAFVALAFLRGAKNPDKLQDKLIAQIPNDRNQKIVADLVPGPTKSGNYDDLLSAGGVEPEEQIEIGKTGVISYGGVNAIDRMLADLNQNASVANANKENGEVIDAPLSATRTVTDSWVSRPWDIHDEDSGVKRVPRRKYNGEGGHWETRTIVNPKTYQNQTIKVWIEGDDGIDPNALDPEDYKRVRR